jgi:plasmid stability protein
MGTLTIRNLDDAIVEKLKSRAKANNRSLEAEARVILESSANRPSRRDLLAELDRIAAMTPKDVKQTDSVEIVREMREERMRRFDEAERESREEDAARRRR